MFIQQSFNSKFVRVTKAQDTPVSQYLASLRCLIAGNSSIHLESAICSCPSIYFELKSQFSSDYYGFVRKNICLSSSSKSSLLAILLDIFSPNYCFSPNIESIQYYSASFGTKWQGKESQLVSSLIQQLSVGKDLPISGVIVILVHFHDYIILYHFCYHHFILLLRRRVLDFYFFVCCYRHYCIPLFAGYMIQIHMKLFLFPRLLTFSMQFTFKSFGFCSTH